MYFADLDAASSRLVALTMTPMRVRHFRLNRASPEEARWLGDTLDRESRPFGLRVDLCADFRLAVRLPL
jgi:poly-gamma-glutamate synthesis protein (capsule biosynthesis protein)